MEPKYKVNPLTGELQEYVFEYNGILALRNFTAKVEDERLILHAADDVNFSILEALVSEVEINGVVYDNPTAAQEALTRLTFNQNRPVLLDKTLKNLILGAVQKVEGKGLSSNDFTNDYKQQLDALEDYDIELDESTTELKFKKGNNVVRRISLMFLDDEGTKLVYNRTGKSLELRDKRDNLLTSIPVSHFVSNIPTGIVIQNGKIKLMAGSEVIDENAISYNDLADKPDLNFAPANHTHNWNDIDGKPNNLATTENIKTAIEGIQIGGRNLVRGTGNFEMLELPFYIQPNFGGNAGVVTETFRGNKIIKLVYNWQGFQCRTTFEDLPMIISFWVKTSKPNIEFFCVTDNTVEYVNGRNVIPDGKWHKYSIRKDSNIVTANTLKKGFVEFNCTTSGKHIEEVYISSFKIEYGNTPTDWTPAPEDLENNLIEKTIAYNEKVLESKDELPIKTRRNILMNNSGSRVNLETLANELTVTTHSGWARINSNGYKIQGKDDNFVLTADGNSISKSELLSLPRGYDTSTSVVLPATTVNDTIFVKAAITLGLENIPNKGSVSFLKTFDNGVVTFTCNGKTIKYINDTSFNGKDGSTATATIFDNKCYIRISNV